MRMQFGSRLGGLAGMRPLTSMAHLLNRHTTHTQALGVVRPFLGLTREDLRAFCIDNNLEWVEDPSNSDEKYMRTRMRNRLAGTENILPTASSGLANSAEHPMPPGERSSFHGLNLWSLACSSLVPKIMTHESD